MPIIATEPLKAAYGSTDRGFVADRKFRVNVKVEK